MSMAAFRTAATAACTEPAAAPDRPPFPGAAGFDGVLAVVDEPEPGLKAVAIPVPPPSTEASGVRGIPTRPAVDIAPLPPAGVIGFASSELGTTTGSVPPSPCGVTGVGRVFAAHHGGGTRHRGSTPAPAGDRDDHVSIDALGKRVCADDREARRAAGLDRPERGDAVVPVNNCGVIGGPFRRSGVRELHHDPMKRLA